MNDLLKFNNVNLDVLTETYNMSFYMSYMSRWPESFVGKKQIGSLSFRMCCHSNFAIAGYIQQRIRCCSIMWLSSSPGIQLFKSRALVAMSALPLQYFETLTTQAPLFITVAEAPNGNLMGYNIGKAEGEGALWHGHVSAVTVAPAYRRLGLAKTLMDDFEHVCIHTYNAYFVDLFVRTSNHLAKTMYEKFGYSTYRRVLGYYAGECPEDALDMRKALPRDKHKQSVIPLDYPVHPEDLEW
jgi:N-terminal acetyltransferase B complex catalytic subunit